MVKYFRMNNNKMSGTSGISRMLVLFAFLIFTGTPSALYAQSVWSGNASVDPEEFVNFVKDFPLAGASSSFTRNTKIEVTNPQNNKTVEVVIVKRAPRPGVFLVLSEEAGHALSIPSGQVIPVQVQVVNSGGTSSYDELKSADPDINPAVTVPTASDAASDLSAPEELPAPSITDSEPLPDSTKDSLGSVPSSGNEPVPVPVPSDTLRVERDEPASDAAAAEVPAPEVPAPEVPAPGVPAPGVSAPEVPAAGASTPEETAVVPESLIPESEASGTMPDSVPADSVSEPEVKMPESGTTESSEVLTNADEIRDSLLPTGDNIIYFLTPSDFRPPTGPVEVKEDKDAIVPVLVERSSLEKFIVNQLKNGSSYIQLGAYTSPESIYEEITSIEARYPMVVWTENTEKGTLYKLLIGPLTKDETGVLSYRFRSTGYSDLFLYKP